MSLRRYELQLWEPDKGGWRTVLTAATEQGLARSARTLQWQTQKPIRILGPDGAVPHDAAGEGEVAHRGQPAPRG
jgi:hypothetical protein